MKSVKLLSGVACAGLALASMLSGCGDGQQSSARSSEASGTPIEAAGAPQSSGTVIVAPVSRVASAPGVDPYNAETIPAMPLSAMAKPGVTK